MNLFNSIQSEIGAFSFLLALTYMLVVSLMKLAFDKEQIGYTSKLANKTLIVFVVGVALYVILFDKSYWFVFRAVVALSCVRFWYGVGLHYIEKAYTFIVGKFWKGLKAVFFTIKDFFELIFGGTLR
jgi:hypothetical protein